MVARFFARLYWRTVKAMIQHSSAAVLALTVFVAYLLFLVVELSAPSAVFLRITRQSWLTIVGSVLAAALFLAIHALIRLLQGAESTMHHDFYSKVVDRFGLLSVFAQRGEDDAQALYRKLLERSNRRVWAFGITNKHFLDQHSSTLLTLLRDREVDIVIAFWDPLAVISADSPAGTPPIGIINLQHQLEGASIPEADWTQHISSRCERLMNSLSAASQLRGRLRLLAVCHAANFSTLIIDDHLFFFPFLVGPDSTNDPMLYVATDRGIGRRIASHYETLIADPSAVRMLTDTESL